MIHTILKRAYSIRRRLFPNADFTAFEVFYSNSNGEGDHKGFFKLK